MSVSIEIIKAFQKMRCYLTQEQENKITEVLNLQLVDFNKRLWGKDNELEFILMLYMLDSCKYIIGFEEAFTKLTNTVSCDFFIITRDEQRIIVEVRTTDKDVLSISKKQLIEKEKFSQIMNADLYFAIKINNTWMFLGADYIKGKNGKITLERDYVYTKFDEIFKSQIFLIPPGIKFSAIYSKSKGLNIPKTDDLYGNLIGYKISYKGNDILSIEDADEPNSKLIFFLQLLEELATIQNEIITNMTEDITLVEAEITEMVSINLASMMICPIERMYDKDRYVTPSEYIYDIIDDSKKSILKKEDFLNALKFLANNDVPIYELINEDLFRRLT